ncbi:MAG: signal protein PDZ [Planctomyces sp.]|uniref:PDZ/DHR/GLGF domain protein n=1 Tax=Rubinisphaera brasiliensis (strain ATCC 49424 / DSM 5305 / JCM 21570 / IAM 15109 / NBRC 103401 / IFAM 1448) TaxID=756272 RepID=F0SPL0_RUBBR|nr:signal protein PDZ [Rubinisphaera brasiliensis]ADY57914.1 PDZ/DHR/GLGF domain protein [Rubinisphaera brasiliensis DSM 5305]MBB02934.1 signal protein PDZ [Planctomyces sp.]
MSKFIFSAVAALSLVAFASVSADAGGCGSGYKKNYGHNYGHNYNYRRPVYHKTYAKPIVHERVVEKPVIREVVVEKPIIKEVIVEKPVIKEVVVEKPVIQEVVVEKPAPPLPSLGFFGVICPEGMLVKEVRPNTEACRLGLQPGDVIKSFDDMRILCEDDWVISLQRAGDVACLKVIPCGEHALVEMHAQLAAGFAY